MIEDIILAAIGIGTLGSVWYTLRPTNLYPKKEKKTYITVNTDKKQPPIMTVLSHMNTLSAQDKKWKRTAEEADYECKVEDFTFFIFWDKEQQEMKIKVKEKGVTWYEFSLFEQQHTMLFLKQREENGKTTENRKKIETFGLWIESLKERYQQEEENRRKDIEVLKKDWEAYKERQERAYRCVLRAIADVPIKEMRYFTKILTLRMKNEYFKVHIKRKGRKVIYEIRFPNDILLLQASIHVKTGEITCAHPAYYIKGERKEKLLEILQTHAEVISGKTNNKKEQPTSSPVVTEKIENKREISPEEEQLFEQVRTIKKQIEWLQEEEILRLELKVHKLLNIEDMFSEAYTEQKNQLQTMLQETVESMEKRKVRELKKRLHIVEKREG